MFQNYSINQTESVPSIKHWLGRQGLQFLEAPTQAEQAFVIQKVSLRHSVINSNHNTMKL